MLFFWNNGTTGTQVLNLKQGFVLGPVVNVYGGRCARNGMHGGMDVREVAEIVVLQEGGRPVREVDL